MAWFVCLHDESVSDDDRVAFEIWRDADPAHAKAYGELERLWAGLGRIERRAQADDVADGARISEQSPASPDRRSVLRRMAVAASVLIVAGLGAYSLTPTGLLADHRTGPGEQRELVLEDGSIAHLNTATALSIDFDMDRRLIRLYDGEAYFEVAADVARPFVVATAFGRVEALGTAFSVRRTRQAVEVIVTESKVAVSARDDGKAIVAAGQGVRLTEVGLGAVTDSVASSALAWRRGRLVFNNRPLGEVLAELERYRRGRIVILDDAVASIPVTGSFAIVDTDITLDTIERILPVRVKRVTELLVLVDSS